MKVVVEIPAAVVSARGAMVVSTVSLSPPLLEQALRAAIETIKTAGARRSFIPHTV